MWITLRRRSGRRPAPTLVPCLIAAVLTASSAVTGDIILPGETIDLDGTTLAERPELGGPTSRLAVVPFVDPAGKFSGLVEVAIRPLIGPGFALNQQYRILEFDDGGLGLEVVALVTDHLYAIPAVDADYLLDSGGTIGPTTTTFLAVERQVVFDFDTPLLAGQSSHTMFALGNGGDLTALGHWGAHIVVQDVFGNVTTAGFESFEPFIPTGPAWVMIPAIALAVSNRRRR